MTRAAAAGIAALALVGLPLLPRAVDAGPETYRVVITGDSIFDDAHLALIAPDRWIDTERGRDPYLVGQQGRHSTSSILPELVARSQPDGWVVIQDNGARTTNPDWRRLMREIVAAVPDDRCLAGVLPVYWPVGASNGNTSYDAQLTKMIIMIEEFAQQPCHAYIGWHVAVSRDPLLLRDAQHPSAAGVTWLANATGLVTATSPDA